MELGDLNQLIERSERSAFRLETLPQYLVPQEAVELAQWGSGMRTPLGTPDTSPWPARVKSGVDSGYRWRRARVLDYPLSEFGHGVDLMDYLREWEPELIA